MQIINISLAIILWAGLQNHVLAEYVFETARNQKLDNYTLQILSDINTYSNRSTERILSKPTIEKYLLYTRQNPSTPQRLYMNDANSISSSNFNAQVPTAVIVHGWTGSSDSDINEAVKNAFLNKSDTNVIVVDWSRVAGKDYVSSTLEVPGVGRLLGRFLAFLSNTSGAKYDDMHLVGFSLGAHLVGNAGRELNGNVARVTGLDPAGPLWIQNSNSLKRTDGVYVESIHTDRGVLGVVKAVGDADFFPNGGFVQPGCAFASCNHNRAWQLFAASIVNNIYANKCKDYIQVIFDNCNGVEVPMGNSDLKKYITGIYRLDTTQNYPYV